MIIVIVIILAVVFLIYSLINKNKTHQNQQEQLQRNWAEITTNFVSWLEIQDQKTKDEWTNLQKMSGKTIKELLVKIPDYREMFRILKKKSEGVQLSLVEESYLNDIIYGQ